MPKISWSLNLQVQGGPKIAASDNVDVEAYDTIEAVIPDDGTEVEVGVQPGGASQVLLLLISSSKYGKDLTYTVTGGVEKVPLDAQQLFLGAGALGLLRNAPNKLVFTNNLSDPATIRILVGRNV
jgi:hypothetical protein